MKTIDYLFLVFCLLALFRSLYIHPLEQSGAIVLALALLSSLFFQSRFWAEHILTLGFWESKARDFKTAGNSWFALRFLAFFGLVLLCYQLYFAL